MRKTCHYLIGLLRALAEMSMGLRSQFSTLEGYHEAMLRSSLQERERKQVDRKAGLSTGGVNGG